MHYRKSLFIVSAILLTGPFWVPHLPQFYGFNLFLYARSVFLLGMSILLGTLFSFIKGERLIWFVERMAQYVKQRFVLVSSLCLSIFFFSLMYVNQSVLLSFMNSADEHSCFFLAECIRSGKFWAKTPPLYDFFEVVHIGSRGEKWFSVYPPGWPLLLAAARELNLGNFANPIMGTLASWLYLLIGRRLYGPSAAMIGLVLMGTSPFYLFTNASFFSHTTCLLMIAIFLYAYLQWKDKKQTVFWATVGALVLGYGLGTRYLSMAAIGFPILIFELIQLTMKKRAWDRSDWSFLALFIFMLLLNLYYNYLITSNPLDPPNHYYHAWERLGFHENYTLIEALITVVTRVFYLIDWFSPGAVALYFLSLLWPVQNKGVARVFPFGFLALVLGYAFYYSWGGNQYGPRYYFEGIPFLSLSLGGAIGQWWKGNRQIKNFIIGFVAFSIASHFYQFAQQSEYFRRVSKERKSLYELAEQTIHEPAIVFIKGFLGDTLVMAEEDAIRNNPRLDALILYAHDRGEQNKELANFYPHRIYYFGRFDRHLKQPYLERAAR